MFFAERLCFVEVKLGRVSRQGSVRHVPFLSILACQIIRHQSRSSVPNVNDRDFHPPRAAVIMAIRAAITISVTSFLLGMYPYKNCCLQALYSRSTQNPLRL